MQSQRSGWAPKLGLWTSEALHKKFRLTSISPCGTKLAWCGTRMLAAASPFTAAWQLAYWNPLSIRDSPRNM
jgi:hypothetical protein